MERKKNLKVKFGLKTTKQAPVKPTNVSHSSAAAIFNQDDDEDEEKGDIDNDGIPSGFKPNKG